MALQVEYFRQPHGGPLQFAFFPEGGGDKLTFGEQTEWVTWDQFESAYHKQERIRSEDDEPLPDLEELKKLWGNATADQT